MSTLTMLGLIAADCTAGGIYAKHYYWQRRARKIDYFATYHPELPTPKLWEKYDDGGTVVQSVLLVPVWWAVAFGEVFCRVFKIGTKLSSRELDERVAALERREERVRKQLEAEEKRLESQKTRPATWGR